jgi:hypothetical protein
MSRNIWFYGLGFQNCVVLNTQETIAISRPSTTGARKDSRVLVTQLDILCVLCINEVY